MSGDKELGTPLNDTAKVLLIVDLLLARATQEGLREDKAEELKATLHEFLDDNSEGINTTLLEAIEIVLKDRGPATPGETLREEEDLQSRIAKAEQSWGTVCHGHPGDCEWGFFSYGDAPPSIGGGVGMFTWFRDRSSMLDFIATTLPYYPEGQSGIDPDLVAANAAQIVEGMRSGRLGDFDGIAQLNKVLETCSQLKWIGTVADLLEGDHPYAAEVRHAFREGDDAKADGGPLAAEDKEPFLDFLEDWGI